MHQQFPADIVLLGHGSHRGKYTDIGLMDAAERLQRLAGPEVRVRMAGFEFTEPNMDVTVTALAEEGSRRIVVVPFFLFDGRHIIEEIPEQLEALSERLPAVEIRYARTFGVDTAMVEICAERIAHALSGERMPFSEALPYLLEQREVGVSLVARGSQPKYDPGTNRDRLAQLIDTALGSGVQVCAAQAEYASPTVPETIDALVEAGARKLVVLPYLFFPGKVLFDNIIPDLENGRRRHPRVDFRLTETLGVDDRMIAMVLDRAWEAVRTPQRERVYAHSVPEALAAWA